jgi:hypothetical protein
VCTGSYRSLATADFYDLHLMTAIAAAVTAHATGASSSSSSGSAGRPIASQDVSMLAWSFGHICSKHWTLGQCAVELMQQVQTVANRCKTVSKPLSTVVIIEPCILLVVSYMTQ